MAKTERGDDQSMEEILSSIRKIASQKTADPVPSDKPKDSWTVDQPLAEPETSRPVFGFKRSMPSSKSILGEAAPSSEKGSGKTPAAAGPSETDVSARNGRGSSTISKDNDQAELATDAVVEDSRAKHATRRAQDGLAKTLEQLGTKQEPATLGKDPPKKASLATTDDLSDLLKEPESQSKSTGADDNAALDRDASLSSKASLELSEKQAKPSWQHNQHDAKETGSKQTKPSVKFSPTDLSEQLGEDRKSQPEADVEETDLTAADLKNEEIETNNETSTGAPSSKDNFPRIARKSGGFYPPADRAKVPMGMAKESLSEDENLDDDNLEDILSEAASKKVATEKKDDSGQSGPAVAPVSTDIDSGDAQETPTSTSLPSQSETSPLDALAAGIAASSAKLSAKPEGENAQPAGTTVATATAKQNTTTSQAGVANSEARTLEDVVTDMLRPMLHEWLEANMPRIVENALRIEVSESAGSSDDRTT